MRFLISLLFAFSLFCSLVPLISGRPTNASVPWAPLPFVETMIFDVFTMNATTFYSVAESSSAEQFAFLSRDSGKSFVSLQLETEALFLTGIIMGDEKIGITNGLGLAKSPNSYTEDGLIFHAHEDVGLIQQVSQSTQLIQDSLPSGFALTGLFQFLKGSYNGAAITYDGGKNYTYYDCGSVSQARYGAFPSRQVWFVGNGQWPNQGNEKISADGKYHLSHRKSVQTKAQGPILMPEVDMSKAVPHKGSPIPKPGPEDWFAQIMRTQDGGATWESVFLNNTFYPNAMAFVDENNGFFVAAGYYGAYIYATKDGGNTWQDVMFDPQCDIMSAWASSPTDWWAGGASFTNKDARYWHSTDAGATWTSGDVPSADEIVSLSMVDATTGFGSMISGGSSCQLYSFDS